MRSLRYLVLFFIAVVAVAFAVANRHHVSFVLDPITGPTSSIAVEWPLFIFLFLALMLGFMFGALAAWYGQRRWRRAARRRAHEVFELRKENERLARHLRVMERAPQFSTFASHTDPQERPLIH